MIVVSSLADVLYHPIDLECVGEQYCLTTVSSLAGLSNIQYAYQQHMG
jgi:hypothetical protein